MEISDQTTCLDPYFASFEESPSSRNYKPETLTNYRYLLRRFGRLLDTEGIAPSVLTPDIAVELGQRLPATPKSQVKVPNLARLFVAHLIEIGVATRPPLMPAQAERVELLSNFETYLIRQRGLSPRTIYHVLRFADRFLDHRFGDHILDLPALTARDVVAFMESLLARKRPFRDKTPATHLRSFFQYLFAQGLTTTNLSLCVLGRISPGARDFLVICRLTRWRPPWPRYAAIRGEARAITIAALESSTEPRAYSRTTSPVLDGLMFLVASLPTHSQAIRFWWIVMEIL